MMKGFSVAMRHAETDLGISSGLIMCFLRHLSGREACQTFDAASDHLNLILGVGLDSSEVNNPPEEFRDVFAMALHLTRADLSTLARNSLDASFAPPKTREAWIADLAAYLG